MENLIVFTINTGIPLTLIDDAFVLGLSLMAFGLPLLALFLFGNWAKRKIDWM